MSLGTEHGYAPVNGLEMYYEIHGSGQPLVLLHGALSATGTSFGKVLPSLAKTRKVIAVAMQVAIQYPDLVRKLVAASITYNKQGFHPGLLEGIDSLKPEDLAGSPFQEEYARTAPNPEDWPTLLEKTKRLDREFEGWTPEAIRSIQAPALIVIGDSDIVRPSTPWRSSGCSAAAWSATSPASHGPSSRCSPAPRTSRSRTAVSGCLR